VTRLRIPVVTGLGHSTGASTVAAALHGRDAGAWAAAADIVVCRGGGESMRAAEALRLAGDPVERERMSVHSRQVPTSVAWPSVLGRTAAAYAAAERLARPRPAATALDVTG